MKMLLRVTTAMAAALTASLTAGTSFADDDCRDPIAEWQPRDVLRQALKAEGWKVRRIRIDDGCYEVRGFDQHGNRVEAKYSPASLRLRELEIENDDDEDDGEHHDRDDDDHDRKDRRLRTHARSAPDSGSPPPRNE
ncbi:MAG: PepSY domain-containing protein [Onishia taeanensis]|uniref:PepSY domain-containing protein n=1 Tax=Onishia taeanensis TaxID=284577 RepID=UPI003C7A509F